jgi:ABC-type uncharacterized transport system ATPase subunit
VRLKISRDRIVNASRELISRLEVDDFTVEDVPIEDIIREVFSSHQQEAAVGAEKKNDQSP